MRNRSTHYARRLSWLRSATILATGTLAVGFATAASAEDTATAATAATASAAQPAAAQPAAATANHDDGIRGARSSLITA